MGKYGYDALQFNISSNTASTAFHNLGPFIDEFSGIEVNAELAETHAMGDAWPENTWTNFSRVTPITLGGFYDDVAASGPHALLGTTNVGAERVIKVNMGTTNAYDKVRAVIRKYTRKPARGALTRYEAELMPTGARTQVAT